MLQKRGSGDTAKEHIKCNLDSLPKNKCNIDWFNSIGYEIPFQYKNISGSVKIIDYGFDGNNVKIEYKGKEHIVLNSSLRYGYFVNFICDVENIEKIKEGFKYTEKLNVTDPWLEEYFQENDKHYFYKLTKGSGKKFNFICPHCKTLKRNKISIYQVTTEKRIRCPICNDNFSYPNRFAYCLFCYLEDKGVITNYQIEYCPKWTNGYRYDNYFTYNNQEYLIEFDGEIGHGNKIFGKNKSYKDKDGLKRDLKKNELAINNNHILIRINATKSNFEFLKENCINQIECVNKYADIINWNEVEIQCQRNIYNEINDYYLKTQNNINEIAKEFKVSIPYVLHVLKLYKKLNLNNYETFIQKYDEKYKKVIDMFKSGMNIDEIEKETGIQRQSIAKYLNRANDKRDINYIPFTNKKKVNVYKNGEFINTYESMSQLSRQAEEDLGVKLDISEISNICNGKNKQAKGYTFSFVA